MLSLKNPPKHHCCLFLAIIIFMKRLNILCGKSAIYFPLFSHPHLCVDCDNPI